MARTRYSVALVALLLLFGCAEQKVDKQISEKETEIEQLQARQAALEGRRKELLDAATSQIDEALTAIVAAREASQDELAQLQVDKQQAAQADEAFWQLGTNLATAGLGIFGLGGVATGIAGVARGAVKARAGKAEGAAMMVKHVAALRADEAVDKALREVDPRIKKLADAAVEMSPEIAELIRARKSL